MHKNLDIDTPEPIYIENADQRSKNQTAPVITRAFSNRIYPIQPKSRPNEA